MRIRVPLPFLVLVSGLWLAGCNTHVDAPLTPKTAQPGLAGIWEGTVGEGTLRLELTETEAKTLEGHVILDLGDNPENLEVLAVGWASPTSFSIVLACPANCVRVLRGVLIDENTIRGKYEEGMPEEDPRVSHDWEAVRVE